MTTTLPDQIMLFCTNPPSHYQDVKHLRFFVLPPPHHHVQHNKSPFSERAAVWTVVMRGERTLSSASIFPTLMQYNVLPSRYLSLSRQVNRLELNYSYHHRLAIAISLSCMGFNHLVEILFTTNTSLSYLNFLCYRITANYALTAE